VCANECPHGSVRGAPGNRRPYRNLMVFFKTTTNDENMREMGVVLRPRHVDEGRTILARSEPEYEYDLDVDRHNELLPLQEQ
jgi:hypothetical protein